MSRSPSRDRSTSRDGRTLAAAAAGGGAFDPATSVSGKRLWLRAKDNGADGSSVTQWMDQSGLGNHSNNIRGIAGPSGTAPTVATASTPGGGKSIRFVNTGYYEFPTIRTGTQTGEVWVVIKSDGSVGKSGCNVPWGFGGNGATHSSGGALYPLGTTIYEDFGVAIQFGTGTQVLAVTSWRLYRMSQNGTWSSSLDGVTQQAGITKTVSWCDTPQIGGATVPSDSYGFTGNIAEVLFLDHIADATETANLKTYFNTEHGLTVA